MIIIAATFDTSHGLERDMDVACCYDPLILPMGHLGEAHSQLDDVWTQDWFFTFVLIAKALYADLLRESRKSLAFYRP